MTDSIVSDLTAATTPLDGTEIYYADQASSDVKVTGANLFSAYSIPAAAAKPSYVSAGFWLDTTTTPYVLKFYDGTDNISIANIDVTANTHTAVASALRAASSGGVLIESNSGGDCMLLGAGGGQGITTYGQLNAGGHIVGGTDAAYNLGGASNRFVNAFLSGGLYVGGTTSANYLDDYEEGTWTPSFTSSGASFAYSFQVGAYVKIGAFVIVNYRIKLSGAPTGTTTNGVFLSGLPFSVRNTSNLFTGQAIGSYFNIDLPTGGTNLGWSVGATGTVMELKNLGDNLAEGGVPASGLTGASTEIRGSFSYITD